MFKDETSKLRKIQKEAGLWIGKLDRGLSAEEAEAFEAWKNADAAHERELNKQQRNWDRLNALVDWKPEHAVEMNPDLLAPSSKRSTNILWVYAFGIAASLAFALILFIGDREMNHNQIADLLPEKNGTLSKVLSDGSKLLQNPATVYEVLYTDTERRIILQRGEIYFDVAKNPARPFVVETGDIEFTAVGTAFNIKVTDVQTRILVEEGIVSAKTNRISRFPDISGNDASAGFEQLLSANQLMTVDAVTRSARIESLPGNAIMQEIAWQHRRLVFRDQSLASIIAEFNRLNDVELVIEDQDLTNITISGNIDSDNVDGLLNLLNAGFGISHVKLDGSTILLSHSIENNSI